MTTSTKTHLLLSSLMLALFAESQAAGSEPFATAFTYQAQLNEGNGPLNGSADLRFELFAVETGGAPVGSTVATNNITVSDGLVAARLDFGVDVFDGGSRWLEVAIRTPHDPTNTAPFTTLAPRQPISPIPYALQTRGIFVDEAGQVSIGATPVQARGIKRAQPPVALQMIVEIDVPGGVGVLGESTATTGDSVGIKGRSASLAGRGIEGTGPAEGIRGEATETSGNTVGIKGITASLDGKGIEGTGPGEGVRGAATSKTGNVVGVKGTTDSVDGKGIEGTGPGKGVLGHATGKAGAATGVQGITDSVDGKGIEGTGPGKGVLGHATGKAGAATGVHGMSDSPSGTGVVGEAEAEGIRGIAGATSGTARGVCGVSPSTSGDGVYGHATATSGAADGVHGRTDSVAGRGVFGEATSTTGTGVSGKAQNGAGVRGEITGTTGEGVQGLATATSGVTNGVLGFSNSPAGRGVFGQAANEGVRGEATASGGAAANGVGVRGVTASPSGAGVMGCGPGPGNCIIPSFISGAGVLGCAMPGPGSGKGAGVAGWSDSPTGRGVYGRAPNEGVRGELTSIGPETAFGVLGRFTTIGNSAIGVYGESHGASSSGYGDGYGVYGRAIGPEGSAGVLAEGDGTDAPGPPGAPRAAALEIRNGVIRVSGDARTAGTIVLPSGGWGSIQSCDALSGPQGHAHNVGFHQEVTLLNDLIVDDSIILATVELNDPEGPSVSYSVHVRNKHPGQATLRVTMLGSQGGACPPPSGTISRSVHYLIINPCNATSECAENPRSNQR